MKKHMNGLLGIISGLVMVFSIAMAGVTCVGPSYQPRVPSCLKK